MMEGLLLWSGAVYVNILIWPDLKCRKLGVYEDGVEVQAGSESLQ